MQDLVGGQIDLMCAEGSQTLTYVRGGKMKAFAVMAKTRWPALPDVPTTDEIGAPGMYISFWHGLWVPKGTPRKSWPGSMTRSWIPWPIRRCGSASPISAR